MIHCGSGRFLRHLKDFSFEVTQCSSKVAVCKSICMELVSGGAVFPNGVKQRKKGQSKMNDLSLFQFDRSFLELMKSDTFPPSDPDFILNEQQVLSRGKRLSAKSMHSSHTKSSNN